MKNEHLAESDWKVLRSLVVECRERYLKGVNVRLVGMLAGDGEESETDRFWKAEGEIKKEVRILRVCLDDHRRSTAVRKAGVMFSCGMLTEEDLAKFSGEFAERVRGIADVLG